jgi:hypothetical protein
MVMTLRYHHHHHRRVAPAQHTQAAVGPTTGRPVRTLPALGQVPAPMPALRATTLRCRVSAKQTCTGRSPSTGTQAQPSAEAEAATRHGPA